MVIATQGESIALSPRLSTSVVLDVQLHDKRTRPERSDRIREPLPYTMWCLMTDRIISAALSYLNNFQRNCSATEQ